MAISDIAPILTPPASPIEAQGIAWSNVESQIGTPLPDDYKAFIGRYGSGRISGFIWVFNPFSNRRTINLISQISLQLQTLKTLARDFGEECPYQLFPASGGLLPFAMTDNGDVIHWLTDGKPDDWTIVVNEARSPKYEEFECEMTLFLRRVLTRESRCALFPETFPASSPSFDPK